MLITKLDGESEPFEPRKLYESLLRAGASDSEAHDIVSLIEKKVTEGMTTTNIYRYALRLLRKMSRAPVAARYSLRRAVLDLGPSGYPFEQLLGEMFRLKGYNTTVGTTLQGRCISHEVDIVARKERELILVEAKFHNAQGFKTDVKVAMYVYARMIDLRDNHYDGLCPTGGTCSSWLVTNTKFTENAIKYGKCTGMRLIGWGYPNEGNLQNLIEETKLHPLSCLTTLTQKERESMYQRGYVLCKDVTEDPNVLENAGVTGSKVDKVLQEAHRLCI
jgi:hypothetical protein